MVSKEVQKVIKDMCDYSSLKLSYEFIVFIVFWERILRSFNMVSRELQSPKLDLSAAIRLLNCAWNELQYLRDNFQSILGT